MYLYDRYMNNLSKILNSWKTVFYKKDIQKICHFSTSFALDKFIQRAKDAATLRNPSYGIYTFQKYDIFEFACKLRKFSYISLETVLQREWIVFQDYSNMIFLISDDTWERQSEWKVFRFHSIKKSILLNPLWVIHRGNYAIASPERALCDRIYLTKNYYFDNLDGIDIEKLRDISKIYQNKRVILEVNQLIQDAQPR